MVILLIEDDKLLSDMYTDGLKLEKHQVFSAKGAQQALNVLHEQKVEVVILDLVLPGRSGVEVLHEMCSYPDWQRIPVILLSEYKKERFHISLKDMEKYCVQRFLYKPEVTPQILNQTVKEVVRAAVQD